MGKAARKWQELGRLSEAKAAAWQAVAARKTALEQPSIWRPLDCEDCQEGSHTWGGHCPEKEARKVAMCWKGTGLQRLPRGQPEQEGHMNSFFLFMKKLATQSSQLMWCTVSEFCKIKPETSVLDPF